MRPRKWCALLVLLRLPGGVLLCQQQLCNLSLLWLVEAWQERGGYSSESLLPPTEISSVNKKSVHLQFFLWYLGCKQSQEIYKSFVTKNYTFDPKAMSSWSVSTRCWSISYYFTPLPHHTSPQLAHNQTRIPGHLYTYKLSPIVVIVCT